MSTKQSFETKAINQANHIFSRTRTMIESAFYQNNVQRIDTPAEAYELALNNPNTIVTDQPIIHTEELGLPANAKVIVDNHGDIVGRTAAARHYTDNPTEDVEKLDKVLREAIFDGRDQTFYATDVVVGLDEDFMVKAHLAIAKGYEINLLSYMLNFQWLNNEYQARYAKSKQYDEGDIYIYANPDWHSDEYPNGLVVVDAEHNAIAVLGLRYFGELKKGTLTLTWAIAHRHGYTASHGGEKSFHFTDRDDAVFAFYGLSGSGKSTLTHNKHDGKFDITVLHDDAFIISRENGTSIALEPSYFDKTNDYLPGTRETQFFTTVMNCGVTLNEKGEKTLVTEDLRNGNGRTIKSRYASVNRVDKETAPITSIFWIMKDNSLPPVVKLTDPIAAATFGATLATKRSTAENVLNADRNALVIEPFANPFRAYPLKDDYADFKELFEKQQVDCYIINTGDFYGQDIDKHTTLDILEKIATGQDTWQPFGPATEMSYMPYEGYLPDFNNDEYRNTVKERLKTRLAWVERYKETHTTNALPEEANQLLQHLIDQF